MHDPAQFVDLARYPVDQPETQGYSSLLEHIHAALAEQGCVHLPGFVLPDAMELLQAEAQSVSSEAYRSYSLVNPYFTRDDPAFETNHPRRRFETRSNAFVPADNFGVDSPLRALYEWPILTDFVRTALKAPEDRFYRYDDPLADVIINVVDPGGGFPWHFDTNTFTVTLGIQPGEGGGLFRYCPNLRSPEHENYTGVSKVLDGDTSAVHSLLLEPGDLQIFLGRYSLHSVSAVEGEISRHVGIFSYADAPFMCGRLERTKQLYGRVLPIHIERDKAGREDALDD